MSDTQRSDDRQGVELDFSVSSDELDAILAGAGDWSELERALSESPDPGTSKAERSRNLTDADKCDSQTDDSVGDALNEAFEDVDSCLNGLDDLLKECSSTEQQDTSAVPEEAAEEKTPSSTAVTLQQETEPSGDETDDVLAELAAISEAAQAVEDPVTGDSSDEAGEAQPDEDQLTTDAVEQLPKGRSIWDKDSSSSGPAKNNPPTPSKATPESEVFEAPAATAPAERPEVAKWPTDIVRCLDQAPRMLLLLLTGLLGLLDLPFAGLSQRCKSLLGILAIATLVVAVVTWIAGTFISFP